LLLWAGCGRFGFADRPAGSDAVATDDATAVDGAPSTRCDPAKPFGVPVPVAGLDAGGFTAIARLSPDEREVVFQRKPTNFKQLYRATRPDPTMPFGAAQLLPINDAAADNYDAMLDEDLVTLVFASPRSGGSGGGIDLWRATRATPQSAFMSPAPIATLDTNSNEDQTYLMGHHVALWYNSSAAGNENVYEAMWTGSDFTGGAAVTSLNSPASDSFPTPSTDGLVVYFSSSRSGNVDIYVGIRASTSATFVVSRVTELATAQDDMPNWISPDLCRLYFTRGALFSPYDARVMVAARQP